MSSPITRWEPGARLSFDVRSQPPSMTELSPYRHVNAPHLEGYMVSRRGEFRLTALPGGRTRLEGSTWYTMAIFPESYPGHGAGVAGRSREARTDLVGDRAHELGGPGGRGDPADARSATGDRGGAGSRRG